jgi:hypothetical protein
MIALNAARLFKRERERERKRDVKVDSTLEGADD